jgi:hypothetical protein
MEFYIFFFSDLLEMHLSQCCTVFLLLLAKNHLSELLSYLRIQYCEYQIVSSSKLGYFLFSICKDYTEPLLQAQYSRLTNSLISWYIAFLEQLVVIQLIRKFYAFMESKGLYTKSYFAKVQFSIINSCLLVSLKQYPSARFSCH